MSKREKIIVMAAIVIVSGGLYYALFFMPAMEQIQALAISIPQLEAEVDTARIRELLYEQARIHLAELEEIWEYQYLPGVLPVFDDAPMLRRVQRLLYPRVLELDVSFSESQLVGGALWLTTVNLDFNADTDTLLDLLEAFAAEEIYNRAIRYTLRGTPRVGVTGLGGGAAQRILQESVALPPGWENLSPAFREAFLLEGTGETLDTAIEGILETSPYIWAVTLFWDILSLN